MRRRKWRTDIEEKKEDKYEDYGIERGVLERVIELQSKDERIRLKIREGRKEGGRGRRRERGRKSRMNDEKDGGRGR